MMATTAERLTALETRMTHVEAAIPLIHKIHESNINQTHMLEEGRRERQSLIDDVKGVKEALRPLEKFNQDSTRARQWGVGLVLMFGGLISWTAGVWDKLGKYIITTR